MFSLTYSQLYGIIAISNQKEVNGMARFSVFCINENKYIQQDNEGDPVYLVADKDRTLFYDFEEADALRTQLDDTTPNCYTVVNEH